MATFTDAHHSTQPLADDATFDQPCDRPADPVGKSEEVPARLDEIRMRVRLAVAHMLPIRTEQERRREHRYPFPYPITMLAADAQGNVIDEKPMFVIGRHLSEKGFDFYSKDPVPHRFLIAQLPVSKEQTVGILMDLNWCRFGQHGWYENGGKFTKVLS